MSAMIELQADDWFNITGRGLMAAVNLRDIPGCPETIRTESNMPIKVGDHIRLDGIEFEIRDIEYARALVSPPFIKPNVSLLVREVGEKTT